MEHRETIQPSSPIIRDHFYTLGYEGKNIDDFVEALQSAGISTVIDIRYHPVSRHKPAFSKNNLLRKLEGKGIQYVHRRDLGVPTDVRRKAAQNGGFQTIRKWYTENVISRLESGDLVETLELCKPPVALMCLEANPSECHRHLLQLELEKAGFHGHNL